MDFHGVPAYLLSHTEHVFDLTIIIILVDVI
jgi:hypothetical protein